MPLNESKNQNLEEFSGYLDPYSDAYAATEEFSSYYTKDVIEVEVEGKPPLPEKQIDEYLSIIFSRENREYAIDSILEWISSKATPKEARRIEVISGQRLDKLNEELKKPNEELKKPFIRKSLGLKLQANGTELLVEQFTTKSSSASKGSRTTRSHSKIKPNEKIISLYKTTDEVRKYIEDHPELGFESR